MTERDAFAVTVEGTDDGARIVVQGDVDIATLPRLEHALKQSLSASPGHVMIDLSAVEFVDSSGLRFLLRASQSAERSGWSLALVRPAGSATKAFELTGADKLLPFVCDHAEPLATAPTGEGHAVGPHADRMLRLHIRGSLDAPRTARLATREAIYDHPAAAANLDSLTLLVSEVVTNAVTHPQLPEDSNVEFTVTITPELTRVLVSDGGPGFEWPADSAASQVQSGYGILLLDAQSSRWGVQRVPGRFTVWFEIDHPPERAAAITPPTPR